MLRRPFFVTALICPLSLACMNGAEGTAVVSRSTLPNGAELVRYGSLGLGSVPTMSADLSIGVVEGDPHEIFGDVRSVDAGRDGTIYVLDTQASEIRAFDGQGRFLRTVASRGEGPGEISEANGLILLGDSLLWVQDHGKWLMLALRPEGGELTRVPMPVRNHGFAWNGTVDDAGRFWKPDSHSDDPQVFPPEVGLAQGTVRSYMKGHDPRTGVTDSVFLGEVGYRALVSRLGSSGWASSRVPFDARPVTTVDPRGGFWHTETASYRIAHLDPNGDTMLVIETDVPSLPVTDDDRSIYVENGAERGPEYRRIAEEVAALMPEWKPVIETLVADDEGRVWVERSMPEGKAPVYDVFTGDGDYEGTVQLGFRPADYLPIRIRHGNLYAIVPNEVDVHTVVRAPIPPELAQASDP